MVLKNEGEPGSEVGPKYRVLQTLDRHLEQFKNLRKTGELHAFFNGHRQICIELTFCKHAQLLTDEEIEELFKKVEVISQTPPDYPFTY